MGASQMFDVLERASHMGARRGSAASERRPWTTAWMIEHTGATNRQIEWWIRKQLFGPGLQGGSGSVRRFTPADFELAAALALLAALGARQDYIETAARSVRDARVDEAGERLVLTLEGTAFRLPLTSPLATAGPAWIVPLSPCPFSPAGDPLSHCSAPAGSPAEVSA